MTEKVASHVAVRWVADRLMVGADSGGRVVPLASWRDREPAWQGLKTSDLLLIAAAACPLYDLIEILMRQRQPLRSAEAQCTGEQLAEPPYRFTAIHIHFQLVGPLEPSAVQRALDLATQKYCSVLSTLRPGVQVTYDYEIHP